MGVVTSIGVAVTTSYGPVAKQRLETAIQAAIQQARAVGLDPEQHGDAIGLLMRYAHNVELATIKEEIVAQRVANLEQQIQHALEVLRQ